MAKILDVSNFDDGTSVVVSEDDEGLQTVSHLIPKSGYPQTSGKRVRLNMDELANKNKTETEE